MGNYKFDFNRGMREKEEAKLSVLEHLLERDRLELYETAEARLQDEHDFGTFIQKKDAEIARLQEIREREAHEKGTFSQQKTAEIARLQEEREQHVTEHGTYQEQEAVAYNKRMAAVHERNTAVQELRTSTDVNTLKTQNAQAAAKENLIANLVKYTDQFRSHQGARRLKNVQFEDFIVDSMGDPQHSNLFYYIDPVTNIRTMIPDGVNTMMDFIIKTKAGLTSIDDIDNLIEDRDEYERNRFLSENAPIPHGFQTDPNQNPYASTNTNNYFAPLPGAANINPSATNTQGAGASTDPQVISNNLMSEGRTRGLIRIKRIGQDKQQGSGKLKKGKIYFFDPETQHISSYDADRTEFGEMAWDDGRSWEFVDVVTEYDEYSKENFDQYFDQYQNNGKYHKSKLRNNLPPYMDNPYPLDSIRAARRSS